nr:retrovirus-related Pol polyprotein from transposon TNT 1-94 [Tanacetum cinerariifolium]
MVVKFFNCQGEGHIGRRCPNPKRRKDATWFRDKVLLVEAQGSGKVLNEEELEFLQTLELQTARQFLLPICLVTNQMFSLRKGIINKTFNVFKNKSKEKEANNIDKETALEKNVKELENIVSKMGQSTQTVHMLTKPQVFYDNNLKQAFVFQNPFYLKKAQQIRPMLYDGGFIAKETNVILIDDFEETLMLEEEKQELSDEQDFWLQTSHPNIDQSASSLSKLRLLGNFLSKELASPKQTALGKDISNSLMAAKVKTINDEVRIQALIDEKRVKLKESSILRTLKLDDAEGKNIEAGVPFFMFPKFVQLLIDHQPGNMSHHKQIYDNPSLIKKVFANMKRVGTSFSGVVTPLFDNMLVPAANEVGLVRYKKSIGLSIELSLSP